MNQEFSSRNLPHDDLKKVVEALPPEVKEVLYAFPQLFVAGGAIRAVIASEPVKDIDIFTTSLDAVPHAVSRYIQQFAPWGGWEEHKTPCTRTITVTNTNLPPVQFINNIAYDSPEQCMMKFDFTVCQAALWHDGDGWRSLCTDEFLRDVADKRLVYTAPNRVEAPGGSLWRAIKYVHRGYSLSQLQLAALVERLVTAIDTARRDEMLACGAEPKHLPEPVDMTASRIAHSFSMSRVSGCSYF